MEQMNRFKEGKKSVYTLVLFYTLKRYHTFSVERKTIEPQYSSCDDRIVLRFFLSKMVDVLLVAR